MGLMPVPVNGQQKTALFRRLVLKLRFQLVVNARIGIIWNIGGARFQALFDKFN